MKDLKISSEFIKEYLEDTLNVKLDSKHRNREFVYLRFVAMKLCRELTNDSFKKIGVLFNRDHATVIHCVNCFDLHENKGYFKEYKQIYDNAISYFKNVFIEIPKLEKLQSLMEARKDYNIKLNKISNHYRNIIRKQRKQIEYYKTSPIFEKMTNLPINEFKELESRINAFFIMNACNEQRKKQRKLLING